MSIQVGSKVVHRAQRAWGVGIVVQVTDDGRRLVVRFAGRDGPTVVSGRDPAVVEVPPETPIDEVGPGGPLQALAGGSPGSPRAFALRTRVLRLEALRRADSLGALLSSRVHVLPHQVGAAGRILADRTPRFVLAGICTIGVLAALALRGLGDEPVLIAGHDIDRHGLADAGARTGDERQLSIERPIPHDP